MVNVKSTDIELILYQLNNRLQYLLYIWETHLSFLMKQLALAFALMISIHSRGQITFIDNNTSWEEVSKNARKSKKLIFIHLESSECEQCNEVATQGFSSSVLKDIYQQNFIAIRSNIATENGQKLARQFNVKGALVSLYVDPDGNILNRFFGSTSNANAYLEHAKVAIGRKDGKQLSDFEKEYKNGERSAAFLKSYIQKRRELNMPSDNLLDEYVGKLPVDSISNFNIVKFIYHQGPALDSRAYKLVQALVPPKTIDSLYKSVPYPDRVAFNNGIINNTFRKAVETKNQQLAYQVSNFLTQTYENNFALGHLNSQRYMLRYFFLTKDTMNYFFQAGSLLDHSYMSLPVDSLKRMDEAALQSNAANQAPLGPAGEKQAVHFAPPSQFYHMDLNEHAWQFYLLNNKRNDLERALMWSKKSMEWHEELRRDKNYLPLGNPAYIDTYAHLLYKLGRKDEAIQWQTKAVEAQKVSGMSWVSMEKDLNEMKAGTLKR